jgi:nucleotide-binding universal stress UspA family protein
MFKTILVPLDGSARAEQALVPALRIAENFGSELLLLRVVLPERLLPVMSQMVVTSEPTPPAVTAPQWDEAQAYLAGLCLPATGLRIRTQVLCGAPPEMIIATAASGAADLIVMSTHGRAGLLRLLYGSVAEAVLRGATVPVLLVPSRGLARHGLEPASTLVARPHDSNVVQAEPP